MYNLEEIEKIKQLVDLLNEYEKRKEEKFEHSNYIWKYDNQWGIQAHRLAIQEEYLCEEESRAIIISKGYNFVKWLIDNHKINRDKLNDKELDIMLDYVQVRGHGDTIKEGDYYCLLVLLAVADDPIRLLISVLK